MTPKEKAQELIDKFMHIKPTKLSDYTHIYYPSAKQCALIVANECLNNCTIQQVSFWEDVKSELEHG